MPVLANRLDDSISNSASQKPIVTMAHVLRNGLFFATRFFLVSRGRHVGGHVVDRLLLIARKIRRGKTFKKNQKAKITLVVQERPWNAYRTVKIDKNQRANLVLPSRRAYCAEY